jgi:hypothetical protein
MATTARQFRLVSTSLLIVAFLVLTLPGCDKATNPVSPTPVLGSPSPVSLTIGGATSLDHPGDTGQLTATVAFSDNTSRDVTAEASWVGQEGLIAITGPGFMRAIRYGTGTVNARYLAVNAAAWVRVAPAGAFLISGSVTAAGGFRLPQARVEVSSRCGTQSTMTGELGDFVLPAEGEATMRVERDGFRAQVKTMTVGTDERVDFELQRLETAGDLSGTYRLTVSASSSCVLPPDVTQRTYDARVMDIEQGLAVLLSGANLVSWGGQAGFTGSRDQSTVRFVVRDTFDDGYNFIERIGPGRDLYYSGTATGTVDQTRIVAAFNGKLELRGSGGGTLAKCEAGDHRFELRRVTSTRAAVHVSINR